MARAPIGASPGLLVATAVVVSALGCGGSSSTPSAQPTLTLLRMEASDSCVVGPGGLPFKTYDVVMADRRADAPWFFVENRDPGGPREIQLTLRLDGTESALSGTLSGPGIVTTSSGRYWVFPSASATATASGGEVVGTFDGGLSAYPYGSSEPSARCEAHDHRFRLSLPAR
jgi:hypothetical protein